MERSDSRSAVLLSSVDMQSTHLTDNWRDLVFTYVAANECDFEENLKVFGASYRDARR